MRALALLIALALCPAQDNAASLVAELKNPKLTLAEREDRERRLLALGAPGALALRNYAEERIERFDARLALLTKPYLSHFERSARKLAESRLDRKTLAEVEKLRHEVLALRADDALTKERIHEVGDPAMARLRELLVVTPEQTLAYDGDLARPRNALRELHGDFDLAVDLFARCDVLLPEKQRTELDLRVTDPDAALLARETWLAQRATSMPEQDREMLEKNRALEGDLDPEEAAGVLDLNLLRIQLGLRALALDVKLASAARDHSNDMRTLGFFAHESPVEGKRSFGDRAARAGTSAHAENIAGGQTTGAGANEGWWYSPGHHKNMLGSHSTVGLGRSETLWTQMFG